MPDDDAAPEWGVRAVLNRLAAKHAPGDPAAIQLFLSEAVPGDEVERFVERLAVDIAEKQGLPLGTINIGRPFKLANSIALSAPLSVIEEMSSRAEIIDLLPADVDDVTIKPVRRRP